MASEGFSSAAIMENISQAAAACDPSIEQCQTLGIRTEQEQTMDFIAVIVFMSFDFLFGLLPIIGYYAS